MNVETNVIHTGDALEKLDELIENSVHAIVTDPPYGLAFMGRDWDDFEPKEYQEWCEEWARKAKRVLRPGGHLLAFSGNRTHHRLFSGVEDAGFEVRDTITWHYGSGFPKALDVSKAIDKQANAEREVIAEREADDIRGGEYRNDHEDTTTYEYTEPATDAAKQWDGWKTTLKPATEFVVVARKPLGEDTVAGNVREWGTGALNIGECRVGSEERENEPPGDNDVYSQASGGHGAVEGRYPSNVVFDETAAANLDDATEDTVSTGGVAAAKNGHKDDRHEWKASHGPNTGGLGDKGGVSRYFYTSKASRAERTLDGKIENAHPTVKPTDLMEWLVTLATAKDQIVLDPFAGSGTTSKAAKNKHREFIGIEKQAQWADVARVRCGLTPDDPSVVRDADDNQAGMEEWT
jgi:site-specific DNA-methyltransferase (adenine-specific)